MPFVIDDLLLAAAIGGGLGGITNRKNPLKGALLGAGMGAAGGLLAPAMGGAAEGVGSLAANPFQNAATAGAYGTNLGSQQTAMLAAQDASLGGSPSLLGQAKPFIDAAGTGMQVANQFKEEPYPQIQGQPLQQRQQNYEGLLNPPQDMASEQEMRKRMMAQYVQNMRG